MKQIDEEFRDHLERTERELVAGGMTPDAARREAQRRFGSFAHYRTECERVRPPTSLLTRHSALLVTIFKDIHYAVRAFRRHPGFLFAVVVTLAVGIGASTVIFSVVDTVVLRPLPYVHADRLVQVGTVYAGRDRLSSTSPQNFFDWRDQNGAFDLLVASRIQSFTLTGDHEPELVLAAGVSAGYFELLGHLPFMGRGILPSDDRPAGNRIVVLSNGAWQRRWGGAPDIVGMTVRLSDRDFEIAGVMPASFTPPEAIYHQDVEMWFPLVFVDDDLTSRDNGFLQVIGRLKGEWSIEQARQSLNVLQRNIYQQNWTDDPRLARFRAGQAVGVEWLHEQTIGQARENLFVFSGAVTFLLLIACANVANLFLVRAVSRDREIAIRTAMGAGQRRIMRQLVTEGLVAAALGAVGGVFLAVAGVRVFRALAPDGIPRVAEIGVDIRVLTFTLIVAVVTGLLFGAAPARRYRRSDVSEALKEGTLTASTNRQQHLLRHGLVVLQTAVAMVLLVGAGLLINSFVRRITVDPGFDPRGIARLSLFLESHDTAEERVAFFDELLTEIRALPGVTSAAATNNLPMTRNRTTATVTVDGQGPSTGDLPAVSVNSVSDGFFETLRIPVVAGRAIERTDELGERVAVVNTAFARAYWGDDASIGRRFKFGAADAAGSWIRVIGVAQEIHQLGLGEPAGPTVYVPQADAPFAYGSVIARTNGDVPKLVAGMRRALFAVEPNLPAESVGSLTDQIRSTVTEPRFYTWLLACFAIVALSLAAIGIYGTVSYSVSQRSHEIGIRLALGAGRRQVRRLVLTQGIIIVTLGLTVGVMGAAMLSRTLSGLVFGIGTLDLPTIIAVVAVVMAVGALATWLPTRRATRVDPMQTLRTE